MRKYNSHGSVTKLLITVFSYLPFCVDKGRTKLCDVKEMIMFLNLRQKAKLWHVSIPCISVQAEFVIWHLLINCYFTTGLGSPAGLGTWSPAHTNDKLILVFQTSGKNLWPNKTCAGSFCQLRVLTIPRCRQSEAAHELTWSQHLVTITVFCKKDSFFIEF